MFVFIYYLLCIFSTIHCIARVTVPETLISTKLAYSHFCTTRPFWKSKLKFLMKTYIICRLSLTNVNDLSGGHLMDESMAHTGDMAQRVGREGCWHKIQDQKILRYLEVAQSDYLHPFLGFVFST